MKIKQEYERKKSGGARPCGGRLYGFYHGKNVKYKFCKKRGWVKIEHNAPAVFKTESFEDKIFREEKNIVKNKAQEPKFEEETKEQNIKKEENKDKLTFIVENYDNQEQQYFQNEQQKTHDHRIYHMIRNKTNKKEETQRCPLCGSTTQQKSEEYSKAA